MFYLKIIRMFASLNLKKTMIQQTTFLLSARRRGFHLVTREILEHLPKPLPQTGLLNLFVQHTSCALSINAQPKQLRPTEHLISSSSQAHSQASFRAREPATPAKYSYCPPPLLFTSQQALRSHCKAHIFSTLLICQQFSSLKSNRSLSTSSFASMAIAPIPLPSHFCVVRAKSKNPLRQPTIQLRKQHKIPQDKTKLIHN